MYAHRRTSFPVAVKAIFALGALSTFLLAPQFAYADFPLITLVSFDGTNGAFPYAGVTLDNSGNLYGTTTYSGYPPSASGTVYKISNNTSHEFTTLASFNGSNGIVPRGGITIDTSGNLYGTTGGGGLGQLGTVYKISNDAGQTLTTLASFSGSNGNDPYAGVTIDGSGNLYGTTNLGGTDYGAGNVFEISNDASHTLTTLLNFNQNNGYRPASGITLDSSGNFYGTTSEGGAFGAGNVFEISNDSNHILTSLVNFSYGTGFPYTNPVNPHGGVTFDNNGNLYGTTSGGGEGSSGTVFEISNDTHHTFNILASFNGTNGRDPESNLTFDNKGNLYGTTFFGGVNNAGTVFKVSNDSSHTLTTLATFDGNNGQYPVSNITLDNATGNLYGTTTGGGAKGFGTVFEIVGAAAVPETSSALSLGLLLTLGTGSVFWRKRRRTGADAVCTIAENG